MSNFKHTPEPWHSDGQAIYATGISLIGSTVNNSNAISPMQDLANAERIVSCVNALAGIENPSDFVEQAKIAIAKIKEQQK